MAILKASGTEIRYRNVIPTAFSRTGYRLRGTRDREIVMKQDTQWIRLVMNKNREALMDGRELC